MRFRNRVAREILEQVPLPYLRLVKLQNCQDCCIATDLVKFMGDSVSRFSAIDWGRRFVPASMVRAERFFSVWSLLIANFRIG